MTTSWTVRRRTRQTIQRNRKWDSHQCPDECYARPAAAGRWPCILRRTEEEDKDDDELDGQEKDEETQQLKNNTHQCPF